MSVLSPSRPIPESLIIKFSAGAYRFHIHEFTPKEWQLIAVKLVLAKGEDAHDSASKWRSDTIFSRIILQERGKKAMLPITQYEIILATFNALNKAASITEFDMELGYRGLIINFI